MKEYFNIRRVIALVFAAFLLFIGVKFYLFVNFYETGQGIYVSRPPSVEAFLPISALLALRQLLEVHVWDYIHPAGLTLFIAIIITAFLFRRFFCSFICPIGTLSDWLHIAGKKSLKKSIQPPKWLDMLLGSLKYLLLAFFFYFTFVAMDIYSVQAFLAAPYNKVADVKMLYFFKNISASGFFTILVLAILSLFIPYFWCRYLCPYGALLAIMAKFSPAKVRRNKETCIDCKKCDKACPVGINVSSKEKVTSTACMACFSCVEACPKEDTLKMSIFNRSIPLKIFALTAVGIFYLFIAWAILTDHWQTRVTAQEWQQVIPVAREFNH